jgi:long-chain fatty acid transport protein
MKLFPLTVGAALALWVTNAILANGVRLPDEDSQAVARGFADVATAENPSALYYNPAGLSQTASASAEVSLMLIDPTESYASADGKSFDLDQKTFAVPSAFAVVPLAPLNGRHIEIGIGAYSPFGLSTQWPDSQSTFRTLATSNSLFYKTGALAFSVPLLPGLSIGATWEYNNVHADLNRGLGIAPTDRFHFAGNGDAPSESVGILWQPLPEHSLGLKFQAKTIFTVNGTVNLDPLNIAYPAHVDWVFPENLVLGYSYRPTPAWNLEFDYDWTNWKRLQSIVLYSPVAPPVPVVFDWQASNYYSLGATRHLNPFWSVSAGYVRVTNSVPTATFNPAVPDMDHNYISGGVGFTAGHWTVQTVLQLDPRETRTVSGSAPSPIGETADGKYTAHFWLSGLSVVRRL